MTLPAIPDEYREKAARLVYGLLGYFSNLVDRQLREEDIMSIARALLDEREVCANIAKSWGDTARKCGQEVEATIADDIAACIVDHPTHSAAAPLEAR